MCRRRAYVNMRFGIDVSRETQIPSARRVFHVNHFSGHPCSFRSFAYAKARKNNVEQILDIDGPDNPPKLICRKAQFFRP